MNYDHGTNGSRRAEADMILDIFEELGLEELPAAERDFLEVMMGDRRQPVSIKQLIWLRNLKKKLL